MTFNIDPDGINIVDGVLFTLLVRLVPCVQVNEFVVADPCGITTVNVSVHLLAFEV